MKESLNKLKFYDRCLLVFVASLIIIIFCSFIYSGNSSFLEIIVMVLIIPGILSLIIIMLGMLYHQFKRKNWVWFILTVAVGFISGLGIILAVLYYFCIMRKEFKKGKGIYK